MKNPLYRNTADIADHEVRLQCLSRTFVRFVVEKYGGKVLIDPDTHATEIDLPGEVEEDCLKELRVLLDYAYS